MGEYAFALPSLGADMDRATVLEWRVGPGDEVRRGDVVAVIDTEKSEIDLEIWHGGTVAEILVPVGEEVEVGTILARLRGVTDAPTPASSPPVAAAGPAPVASAAAATPPPVRSPLVRHLAEDAHLDLGGVRGTGPAGALTRHDVEEAVAARAPRPPAPAVPVPAPAGARTPASPKARRLASERGIDLASIRGRGPSGAVLAGDVLAVAASGPAVAAASDRVDTMRRAVAQLMARSNREIPHYHLAQDIDMAVAMAWMEARNADVPPARRLLPAALLLRATAVAAAAHPELNGSGSTIGSCPATPYTWGWPSPCAGAASCRRRSSTPSSCR